MIGVVLSGGQSLRMGSDKGLLKNSKGSSWAEMACQKLSILKIPVVISINDQQEKYEDIFPKDQLIIDDRNLMIRGPLLGLMTVHLQFPDEDLFVLACDMRDMRTDVLDFLVKQFVQDPFEAMVFSNEEFPEPLCGIYTAKAWQKIYSLYQNKCLSKHSMQYVLSQLSTFQFELPNKWESSFKNYNSRISF